MLHILRNSLSRRLLFNLTALFVLASSFLYYILEFIAKPSVLTSCRSFISGQIPLLPTNVNRCQYLLLILDLIPEILKALIGTSVTAGFFVIVWNFVAGDEEDLTDVQVLDRPACKKRHREALANTDFWYHNGHLANWVRGNVLPSFRDRTKEMASLQIYVAIIDPADESLCQKYLDHVGALPPSEQKSSSLEEVRVELCATILSLFYEHCKSPNIDCRVYLKSSLDYFRRDISSECSFLTIIGSDTPGIVINKRGDSSTFYNIEKANFVALSKSLKKIDFDNYEKTLDSELEYKVGCAERALSHLLSQAAFINTAFAQRALNKVKVIEK